MLVAVNAHTCLTPAQFMQMEAPSSDMGSACWSAPRSSSRPKPPAATQLFSLPDHLISAHILLHVADPACMRAFAASCKAAHSMSSSTHLQAGWLLRHRSTAALYRAAGSTEPPWEKGSEAPGKYISNVMELFDSISPVPSSQPV